MAVAELMAALKDADPSARRQAIFALGELSGRNATGAIIRALDDPDFDVRLEAVIALGKIGDPAAIEPLIDKLDSDDYFYVRKKAGYTLYLFLKQNNLDKRLRDKIMARWRSWYLT